MSMADQPSGRPTTLQVLAALRRVAAPGCLTVGSSRCQRDLQEFGMDLATLSEFIVEDCEFALCKHEPDDDPNRHDYIAVLKIDDGEEYFYTKIAMRLPELYPGRLISYHLWID